MRPVHMLKTCDIELTKRFYIGGNRTRIEPYFHDKIVILREKKSLHMQILRYLMSKSGQLTDFDDRIWNPISLLLLLLFVVVLAIVRQHGCGPMCVFEIGPRQTH